MPTEPIMSIMPHPRLPTKKHLPPRKPPISLTKSLLHSIKRGHIYSKFNLQDTFVLKIFFKQIKKTYICSVYFTRCIIRKVKTRRMQGAQSTLDRGRLVSSGMALLNVKASLTLCLLDYFERRKFKKCVNGNV